MDKKYDHSTTEKEIQTFWKEYNVYAFDENRGPIWSIDTPPPTVSGSLHIGHIFSYTQTDLIARYKRLSGYAVFYPMGFDDNGLPTERFVEKKLKIKAHELGRQAFIQACLEQTKIVEAEFEHLFSSIGFSVDWHKTYSTISENTRRLSQLSFIILYEKGYIYRRPEPALWCPTCRTAVAQAELDDQSKDGTMYDILFQSSQNQDKPFTISTTRPELIAAAQALVFHPEDEQYNTLPDDTIATVPLYERTIPILSDEDVNPKKGTGLVMVSTFGDKQDVIWAKRHGLDYRASLTKRGTMSTEAGPLEGLKVIDARKEIIRLLDAKGLVTGSQDIKQSINVHERCKNPIEYLILPQWFLRIIDHKRKFLEAADQIEWHPTFMKARYIDWVENIGWNWCLSRQRFYGIPFPAWHCGSCGEIILADKTQLPLDPIETPYTGTCPVCASSDIVPDTDVMDTWNTSSLTPYICGQLLTNLDDQSGVQQQNDLTVPPSFLPMSMRPQAHDIIRTWAFYTIAKTWMHSDEIPWQTIVISGHVLSKEQKKLSKSKENSQQRPEQLLNMYPADAIRYWTASGLLGHDTAFSPDQIKQGQRIIVKLWNAFRYAEAHIQEQTKEPETLSPLDQWLVHTLSNAYERYNEQFKQFESAHALNIVETFFFSDFCDNYLELIKDQLYNPDQYEPGTIQSTRWALRYTSFALLQLFAPFLPHVTEKLYQLFFKTTDAPSIHLTRYDDHISCQTYAESAAIIAKLLELVGKIRKLKTHHQLSLGAPIQKLSISSSDKKIVTGLKTLSRMIKGVTRAHEVTFADSIDAQDQLIQKHDEWHAHIRV